MHDATPFSSFAAKCTSFGLRQLSVVLALVFLQLLFSFSLVGHDKGLVGQSSHSETAITTPATSPEDGFPTTSCLALNSATWLTGQRWGNINGKDDDDEDLVRYAKQMILDLPKALAEPGALRPYLEQTLAYDTSSWVDDTAFQNNTKTIRQWATRLSYLSVMYHQHRHAGEEAQARYLPDGSISPSCQKELDEHNIGPFDFECPNAKYILARLPSCGMGCVIRGTTYEMLRAALATDRILVFVNRAWGLASCERKDHQCVFRPITPCVLTARDIQKAYSLDYREHRELLQQNKLLEDKKHHKVWRLRHFYSPHHAWTDLSHYALSKHVETLLQPIPPIDSRLETIRLAATKMLEPVEREQGYKQGGPVWHFVSSNSPINHALGFYVLRPRPKYAKQINKIVDSIVGDSDPEFSFGLPIRASDKCGTESECLAFPDYMRSTSVVWQRHQNATNTKANPTVVFTTESTDMLSEQEAFVSNKTLQSKYPMEFRFLVNKFDVTPDTGANKKNDKDQQMLSAMVSLKLQMYPRVSVLNCCSNFHTLMSDFLQEGLGKASDHTFMCQNELDDIDVSLVICCTWYPQCLKDKQEKMANQSTFSAGLLMEVLQKQA